MSRARSSIQVHICLLFDCSNSSCALVKEVWSCVQTYIKMLVNKVYYRMWVIQCIMRAAQLYVSDKWISISRQRAARHLWNDTLCVESRVYFCHGGGM